MKLNVIHKIGSNLTLVFIFTLVTGLFQGALAYESKRPEQRELYLKALELQEQHKWADYQALLPKLEAYPLVPYLEYQDIIRQLSKRKPAEVLSFIGKYPNSPLANRLERKYLFSLARAKQWQSFLDFYPKEPKSVSLRCRHYQAKYETGKKAEALKGAQDLWLYGRSRPKACNALFKTFTLSGKLTEELIWKRMELAFAARKFSLLSYLQKMLPASSKKQGRLLLNTYRAPNALLNFALYSEKSSRIDKIITLGIKSLSKQELSEAKKAWGHYSKWSGLNEPQRRDIETQFIRQAYLDRGKANIAWADKMLNVWRDPKQIEWRIRIALKDLDWSTVSTWILRLPKHKQEKDLWRYWAARSAQELGQTAKAQLSYEKLAGERTFYGFLAADILKKPYKLNEKSVDDVAPKKALAILPAFIRIEELLLLGFDQAARIEWVTLIDGRGNGELLELAQLALDRRWHHFSVLATIEARAWNLLSMRFPKAQFDNFTFFADERKLELSYLYAIARQESALNPYAESPVGARGLMQLMPATAKETARKIGFAYKGRDQLLDPNVNIRLGSAYINQLLEKYDGNRLLATAAYNAGPHRVKRWHNKNKRAGLPADVWVETIPYRETRGYVKNVLSFNLIYGHFLGNDPKGALIDPKEQILLY